MGYRVEQRLQGLIFVLIDLYSFYVVACMHLRFVVKFGGILRRTIITWTDFCVNSDLLSSWNCDVYFDI